MTLSWLKSIAVVNIVASHTVQPLPDMMVCSKYRITGIIRGRKVSQITFFAVVREKTFAIQAISYIKIPAKIKSARKHSRMLPDS